MISEIQIENFKSIAKLSIKPGNVRDALACCSGTESV